LPNHLQRPAKQPNRNLLLFTAGLILFLILLAGWYLFAGGMQSGPVNIPDSTETPGHESSETEAGESLEETPGGVPEGVPEEDAPGTPTPSFMDDFEDGLGPVWTVHYGDPFISQGQLTSNVGAGLAAGDSSWENYQIDFDVDTTQIGCSFVDTSNSVGVRVTDFDHAYWFVFNDCHAGWSLFAGGVSQGVPALLPDTTVDVAQGIKHITIKVDEAQISAYQEGTLLSSITDSRFRTGGIFLQVEAQTLFDNFRVTLSP
jgi:hypothetical protein